MKRLVGYLLVILFTLSVSAPLAHSAVTPGSKCSKTGVKQVFRGKTYTCIKLGKKLYWNNGVVVKVTSLPSPTVTVIATPSPAPTVTVTAIPSPAPTVTVTATPSPTLKSLSIKIVVSSQGSIYWGPLPFTCSNPPSPSYGTIFNLGWNTVSLKIYDGYGRLVGVPDFTPRVTLEEGGGCSISYQYSNLSLESGPLVVKTGLYAEWNISEKNWISGSIILSGDTVRFSSW